jgi:hypothetical protein
MPEVSPAAESTALAANTNVRRVDNLNSKYGASFRGGIINNIAAGPDLGHDCALIAVIVLLAR